MRTSTMLLPLPAILLLSACAYDPKSDTGVGAGQSETQDSEHDSGPQIDSDTGSGHSGDTGPLDVDGDGVAASEDCDDADPAVYPGAGEILDWVDQDCDAHLGTWPVDVAPLMIVGEEASLSMTFAFGDLDSDGRSDLVLGSDVYTDDEEDDDTTDGYDGMLWLFETNGEGRLSLLWQSEPTTLSTAAADRMIAGPSGSRVGKSPLKIANDALGAGEPALLVPALWLDATGENYRSGVVYAVELDDVPSRDSDPDSRLSLSETCLDEGPLCVSGGSTRVFFGYNVDWWTGPDGTTPMLVVGSGSDDSSGYLDFIDVSDGISAAEVEDLKGTFLKGGERAGSLRDRRFGAIGGRDEISNAFGDGAHDYAVGSIEAPWDSESDTDGPGMVYLISGAEISKRTLDPVGSTAVDVMDVSIMIRGESDGDGFGSNVIGADLNGDEYGDLIVVAGSADGPVGGESSGLVYMIPGPFLATGEGELMYPGDGEIYDVDDLIAERGGAIWEGEAVRIMDMDCDGEDDMYFIVSSGADYDIDGDEVIDEDVGVTIAVPSSDILSGGDLSGGNLRFVGVASGDSMSVQDAGDIDGDGCNDLGFFSSRHDSLGVTDAGAMWLMPGTLDW